VPSALSIGIFLSSWDEGNEARWLEDAIVWPHQEFLSLIYRSSCCLHELIFANVNVTAFQLVACLAEMPSLQAFELEEPPRFDSGELVDALAYPQIPPSPAQKALVPKLARLKLKGYLSFSDDAFVEMVESRVGSRTPLASINITFRARIMHEFAKLRLSALAVGGLKVLISEI
jgi:hypothetical protein